MKKHLCAVLATVLGASITIARADETLLTEELTATSDYTPITYDSDFFEGKTYEWKDSDGVSHTSNLMEKATSWEQMKKFVYTIMTDRTIPGMIKDPTPEDMLPTNGRLSNKNKLTDVQSAPYSSAYSEYGIPSGDKTPYEDGMTAILVCLKPNVKEALSNSLSVENLMRTAVESMEIMPNRLRVEGDNPGWIFNLKAPLNKFFIMTKGKLRPSANTERPFNWMFEQFSPAEDGSVPTNTYEAMLSKQQYEIKHDCKSAITKYHPVLMGDIENKEDYMSSILIFIPDYRFAALQEADADKTDSSGKKYRVNEQKKYNKNIYVGEDWSNDYYNSFIYYNPGFKPYFLFNNASLVVLSVSDDKSSVENRYCEVNLKWSTEISKTLASSDVREVFHLYRVVDGLKVEIPLDELEITDESIEVKEVDGKLTFYRKGDDVEMAVKEPQYLNGYQCEYIVEATVENTAMNNVESNTITALIPGYSPLERCELTVIGTPESKFVYENDSEGNEADYNKYKHSFGLSNHSEYKYPLLAGHLKKGTDEEDRYFKLTRALSREDILAGENVEELEKLTITGYTAKSDGYTYFSGKYSTDETSTELFRALTADGDNAVVESITSDEFVWFVSEFTALTKDNLHPGNYYYRLISNIPIYDEDSQTTGTAQSMVIQIDIPHTENRATFSGYSKEDVLKDTGRDLTVSDKIAHYDIKNNSDVELYTLNVAGSHHEGFINLAQTRRAQDGTYNQVIYNYDDDEEDDESVEVTIGRQDVPLVSDYGTDFQVVTVITDFSGNTYGSGRSDYPTDVTIKGGITSIDRSYGSVYEVKASWQPDYSEDNSKYLKDTGYYNAWVAIDSDEHNVNVYDPDFWANHSGLTLVKDVNAKINSKAAISSSAETIEEDLTFNFTPNWTVGTDTDAGEKPVIASILVRYYPELLSEEDEYGVFEYYYSTYTDGNGLATGVEDVLEGEQEDIYVYSPNGVLLRRIAMPTANASDLDLSSLPEGVLIVRQGAASRKIYNYGR